MYRAISNIRWNEKSFSINTFYSTRETLYIFSIDNIAIFLKKIFPCISIGFNKIFQKHFLYNNSALVTKTVNWTFLRVLGLMKKISGDDYRFPRLEKRREGKGEITRAPGWEYKWPQVGQQTETMKTKSVRIYPGLHVVSARAPPRFIALSSSSRLFTVTRKTSKGQLKDASLPYAFIALWFRRNRSKLTYLM